jgi:hypothetical protein
MKHLLQHFFLFCHSGSPSSPKSPDLWDLSYHNAKVFATEIADRDICILAEKVTAQGVLLGNLRKRQMSPFDKRPSSVSAARKARRG